MMDPIGLGKVIAAKRKEHGLTQEELSSYFGVSKPAVSKWESGQFYPDISLLPQLASFFDISLDELLDYKPQLSKEAIREQYKRLSEAFGSKASFDQTFATCKELIRKYYSCFPFLENMGILFLNTAVTVPEKRELLLSEATLLFERVEENCNDFDRARQARCLRASVYLMQQKPQPAIDLLEELCVTPLSAEKLLADAYLLKGDMEKGKSLLQEVIISGLAGILDATSSLLGCYTGQPEQLERWLSSAKALWQAYGLEQMHPGILFPLLLNAAGAYLMQGQREKALEQLEHYTDIATDPGIYPLKLRGSSQFDLLEPRLQELELGTLMPRSEEAVKRDLREVVKLPLFAPLKEEPRFIRIQKRLEALD